MELEKKMIEIFYRCEHPSCYDLNDPNSNITKIDHIGINTKQYIVDHYGDIPLKISKDYDYINSFYYKFKTSFDATIRWISIIYKEKLG